MHFKTTAVFLTAALALPAGSALAKPAPKPMGKTTAPGQLCKAQSHKKTNKGKGKSPFAACVIGAKRAQTEIKAAPSTTTAPGKLCKDLSHKKSSTDSKSPFAACVTGVAKARHAAS